MQLHSISLKNIRSYSSLELNFKSGSTLLSGDIGSGKTTILLSIEFAFFGLMKGMLSGSSLLRHGSKEGSVTLSFSSDKKEYTIHRALKKTSSGIVQDAGYIQINGERKDCTAVELKSKILSILGYPDELLSKSKSLIFRYTVYTPQEDMKKIIFDSEEDRVEKLTKIFNVEKYKRVRENAEIYAKELRAETKILQALENELSSLKEQEKKYETEMEEKNILLQKTIQSISSEEKNMKESEQKLKDIEDSVKELNTLKQELKILGVEKANIIKNSASIKIDLSNLELQRNKSIEENSVEKTSPNVDQSQHKKEEKEQKEKRKKEEILEDIKKSRELKIETENKIIDIKSRISLLEKRIYESKKTIKELSALTKCPTCQQEVNEEHKSKISSDEEKKISEYSEKKTQAEQFLQKAENNISILNKRIESYEKELLQAKEIENKKELLLLKEKNLQETEEKIIRLKDKLKTYDEDLKSNESLTSKLNEKLEENIIDEKAVEEVKTQFKKSKDNFLSLKINEAKISQSITENSKQMEKNILEQEKKNSEIEKVKKKKTLEHWISNHFISLVELIEKNVMASIRAEFKEHFEEWFSMLIEDESISATLDERFTPVITQNGYDTEIENLSGGEKTAVALAYRLALNKVINSMMSNIKTKDIIILDEPTDGFSSHQLDKVREVLEALNSKQTIIVSHESKMESFVDHIIKIRKHEHSSEII